VGAAVSAEELDVHAELGVEREEFVHERAEHEAGEGYGSTDAQFASGPGEHGADGEVGLFGFVHDTLAMGEIEPADLCEPDAAGGAFDELHGQAFFEPHDGAADGGFWNAEAFGGLGEAPGLGYQDEEANFVKVGHDPVIVACLEQCIADEEIVASGSAPAHSKDTCSMKRRNDDVLDYWSYGKCGK
jgi:hypothetical protein